VAGVPSAGNQGGVDPGVEPLCYLRMVLVLGILTGD